jgi:hypothetical protein
MSFQQVAVSIINRIGARVIAANTPDHGDPKAPNTKLCPNGAKDATRDDLTIAKWNRESPDANLGVVAEPETVFIVDEDKVGSVPPDLFADRLTVETASGKKHYYFRQNDETRTWANHSEKYTDESGEKHEAFSVRLRNQYVLGPGSVVNGKPYKIVNDIRIAEPTETQLQWLRQYMVKVATASEMEMKRKLHPDFTMEKFLAYYGKKYRKDSIKYHVHSLENNGCPCAGRLHMIDGSGKPRALEQTCFVYIEGHPPGFECLSGGCEGKTFKDAHTALIKATGKKPFPVWEKEEETTEVLLERGDSIKRVAVSWLWKPYLALRKLTHGGGESSMGKSPAMVNIAALVTAGADWPDGTKNELGPRSVVMLASEDDWNDTVMPRFDLAGGDDKKLFLVRTVRMTKGEKSADRMLRLDIDMAALRKQAEEIDDLVLVVIDPITNYLGARKMNAETEVRSILTPLADLAQQRNLAAVTIGHINRRDPGTSALFRFMGAAAFTGVSREVLTFGPDNDTSEPYHRVMVPTRSRQAGLKYSTYAAMRKIVNDEGALVDCEVIGVKWGEKVTVDAQDVLEPQSQRTKGKYAEAAAALRQILARGKVPARTAINEMKNIGFDLDKMESSEVRRLAGVKSTNSGRNSEWYLATAADTPPESEQIGIEPDCWEEGRE